MCIWDILYHLVSQCFRICCIYGTTINILKQWEHIVTGVIKDKLMNCLKILNCCIFTWKFYGISVVKKKLTFTSICNLVQVCSAVAVMVQYKGPKDCLTRMYTHNMHRIFGMYHMCHILVLYLIAYGNAF